MSSTNRKQGSEKGPLHETTSLLNHDVKKEESSTTTRLQQPSTPASTINRNHWAQTWALAFSVLVQSYLLVSVFPYSGFLAMKMVPGLTEESAGSYAGWIASSFMVGRTISSLEWGKAADKYGRTFVIKTSLVLSAIFSILFGFSSTFTMALFTRCLMGLCNGLNGAVRTIVSELCHGDKSRETRLIAIVGGMWGYGFLLNPVIGGYLSDPVKQYPDSWLVERARPLLSAYPFLLPNLIGFLLCILGFVLMHCNVEETLPEDQRQEFHFLPCWPPTSHPTVVRRLSSEGLTKQSNEYHDEEATYDEMSIVIDSNKEGEDQEPATIQSLWARPSTRNHLLIYWINSFLIIAIDEIFPLYCISKSSGLGVQEKTIGGILSGTGVFYILLQYFLLTKLVDWYGFYVALRIAALLSVPVVALIPLSLMTNRSAVEGTLNFSTLVLLCLSLAVSKTFSSIMVSTLALTTNRTVPAHQRATMNGLSMFGSSLGRAAGPAFAGFLFSTSVNHVKPPYGSVVAYDVVAILGVCLFVVTLLLEEHDEPAEKADPIHIKEDQHQNNTSE
eukprot:Nitzschia sp. Nitz4//scaffold82_size85912//80111//81787//NITZ4_005155-RA/size85912-processed-gene-0.20-mRNA-1//1//CDS//3329558877//4589//frame0